MAYSAPWLRKSSAHDVTTRRDAGEPRISDVKPSSKWWAASSCERDSLGRRLRGSRRRQGCWKRRLQDLRATRSRCCARSATKRSPAKGRSTPSADRIRCRPARTIRTEVYLRMGHPDDGGAPGDARPSACARGGEQQRRTRAIAAGDGHGQVDAHDAQRTDAAEGRSPARRHHARRRDRCVVDLQFA